MFFKVLIVFALLAKFINGNAINKEITIGNLSILKSPYVHMKNESKVFEKINKIISDGSDKFQIITDFDRTLTKQHENITTIRDSYSMFYKSKQLPQSNMEKINVVRSKFLAIHLNGTVSEDKIKQISDELFRVSEENLHNIPFDRKEFEEIIEKYRPSFRDKTDELFTRLYNLNVPVTIFSAGVGDIIEVQLKQKNLKYDNINMIANYLKFDGAMLDGYQNSDKPVHTYNKQDHLLHNIDPEILKNRKNIVLMGDILEDAEMVSSLDNEFTILKIGFFHDQPDEVLKKYEEAFDIVLDDDQTMNVLLDIVEYL